MTTTRAMARRPPASEAATISSTPGLASPRTRATTWAPTALNTYTGTARRSTRRMSSRASRDGVAREGTMPSTSLLDSRPDRIPPRAPALLRWAGTREEVGPAPRGGRGPGGHDADHDFARQRPQRVPAQAAGTAKVGGDDHQQRGVGVKRREAPPHHEAGHGAHRPRHDQHRQR